MDEPRTACPFCGKPPKQVWKSEVVVFECGTRPHHKEPATMDCWGGLVMKLRERLGVLEKIVLRRRPVTLRELSVAQGWHPEIKSG